MVALFGPSINALYNEARIRDLRLQLESVSVDYKAGFEDYYTLYHISTLRYLGMKIGVCASPLVIEALNNTKGHQTYNKNTSEYKMGFRDSLCLFNPSLARNIEFVKSPTLLDLEKRLSEG